MTGWIKKKCLTCEKDFFIRLDWLNPPTICDFCKAKNVGNIVQKLKNYLQNRKKYEGRPALSAMDKMMIQKDVQLRSQIESILSKYDLDHNTLISELIEDKQIRSLVIRLEKESKINGKSKNRYAQQKTGKIATISNITLVQGGSPGLGKKA